MADTAAVPFVRFMDMAYRSYAARPFRFPGLMWVDDTIVLLEGGDACPIQGFLPDRWTYHQRILRVNILDRKMQHESTSSPPPLCSPTPEVRGPRMGDG